MKHDAATEEINVTQPERRYFAPTQTTDAQQQHQPAVSKFKTAEDSNESLLGPAAIAAQRQLLSVPVRVSANVPDDLLLVIDRRAVLSAYGALMVAVSEHAEFKRDALVTRITWRLGATIAHPERVVELRVAGVGGATKAAPGERSGQGLNSPGTITPPWCRSSLYGETPRTVYAHMRDQSVAHDRVIFKPDFADLS